MLDSAKTAARGGLTSCQRAKSLQVSLCLTTVLGGCNQSSAATFTEPMTLGGREVSPDTLNHGRDLYFKYCVSCHGETGAGDGPAARSLKFPPRDFRVAEFSFAPNGGREGQLPSHEALVERISAGVPERGMPPWKGMRDEDLSAVADYIKTFSERWQAAPVAPPPAPAAKDPS